jgi:hypothetical protein
MESSRSHSSSVRPVAMPLRARSVVVSSRRMQPRGPPPTGAGCPRGGWDCVGNTKPLFTRVQPAGPPSAPCRRPPAPVALAASASSGSLPQRRAARRHKAQRGLDMPLRIGEGGVARLGKAGGGNFRRDCTGAAPRWQKGHVAISRANTRPSSLAHFP